MGPARHDRPAGRRNDLSASNGHRPRDLGGLGRSREFWRLIAERRRLLAMLDDRTAVGMFGRGQIALELVRNETDIRELAAWHQRR